MSDIQVILGNGAYSLALLFLIGLPLIAAPIVYFAGRFFKVARWAALIAIGLAWIPFVIAAQVIGEGSITVVIGGMTLRIDSISLVLAAIALSLGTLVVLYSNRYMAHEENEDKYYAMLVALVGVMIGLGCATDLFNLWVWFEAMAISSYLLVAFYRDQPASLEAGVKYLVQSAVGSVLVLLGIALVLALTGTMNLAEIRVAAARADAPASAGGGRAVPDRLRREGRAGADAHVAARRALASAQRHQRDAVGRGDRSGLDRAAARRGFVVGRDALVGRAADGLRRVEHAGRQPAGAAAEASETHAGVFESEPHGLHAAGFGHRGLHGSKRGRIRQFLPSDQSRLDEGPRLPRGRRAAVRAVHQDRRSSFAADDRDLGGAARKYPIVAFTLSIAVLGLAGLPPFAGFMSKWQIFAAGFETQNIAIDLLVIFAALNSVLSLAYYAPIVNAVYRQEPSEAVTRGQAMSWTMSVPLMLLAVAIVILGVWPSLLAWLTGPAGVDLVRAFGG